MPYPKPSRIQLWNYIKSTGEQAESRNTPFQLSNQSMTSYKINNDNQSRQVTWTVFESLTNCGALLPYKSSRWNRLVIIHIGIPPCAIVMSPGMPPALPQVNFWRGDPGSLPAPNQPVPFAGRVGANQQFSLDKDNCTDRAILEKYPDAAPWLPLRDSLSLKGFRGVEIWKSAFVEGIGMFESIGHILLRDWSDFFIATSDLLGSIFNSSFPHRACRNDAVSSPISLP